MPIDQTPAEIAELPQSFIKNVALRLPADFKLLNSPFPLLKDKEKSDQTFIGHEENIEKFLKFLDSRSGVFLVTGYRGMGKTSFVNRVINEFTVRECKKPVEEGKLKKDPQDIHLTLAQNSPKEIDILRLMTSSAFGKFKAIYDGLDEKQSEDQRKRRFRRWTYCLIAMITLLGFPLLVLQEPKQIQQFIAQGWIADYITIGDLKATSYTILLFSNIFIVSYFVFFVRFKTREKSKDKDSFKDIYKRIKNLNKRCYASLLHERNQSESFNLGGKVPLYNFLTGRRKTKQYPIASTKEIEYQLAEFLTDAKEKGIHFLFIFDELDKIDPAPDTAYLSGDLENTEKQRAENATQIDLRKRKQAVINVIAGLKNFLTSASAQFVFIAGREMFDASLADIADRQSSISSIFTYIFYIESLLKTNSQSPNIGNNSSLSYSIEEYLNRMLFGVIADNKQGLYTNLNNYSMLTSPQKVDTAESSTESSDGEKVKLYFIIQNFITYLTYRSNGSPKKMIRAIQEFIAIRNIEDCKKNLVYVTGTRIKQKDDQLDCYLYFNYYNQYRIGFLSYLYRPFLIQYGRSFKLYSDNINVSTPYLFDHLIKFHPFAFSITNLELIPEVLSTNKTPALKEHIRQIINHLGANHLRETEIGLFDYKFYSRTDNEITFLSKIFEQEAAAFNFTLDESLLVKLHMLSKIKELRDIYSKFSGGDNEVKSKQIYSIAHINGILGDLHFFDQDYDDAIVAYSDANRPLNTLDFSIMNMRDFVTLVKNQLKQGLCFEKMGAFEEALAFYTDSSEDAKNFILNRITSSDYFPETKVIKSRDPDRRNNYHNSSLNDVLEIIVQSFLAKIIVQEKMGLDGISGRKILLDLGSFLHIINKIEKISGRSYLIAANSYLLAGKLAYYKNSPSGFGDSRLPEGAPADVINNIAKFNGNFNSKLPGNEHTRRPVVALYLYILGLSEVIESRSLKNSRPKPGVKKKNTFLEEVYSHENISYGLLSEVEGAFKLTDNQLYTGLHYSQMGTFLSNIGDCLLSMFIPDYKAAVEKKSKVKNFPVGTLFNFSKVIEGKDSEMLFYERLGDSKIDEIQLVDILKCYFLSGKYFLRYGRSHSCSFQYRKILWILRLVLVKTDSDKDSIDETFLGFLRNTVIIPALKIANQNSEHSENHIYNKAHEHYHLDQAFTLNNLSNHPETREIILLYNYIELKLGKKVIVDKLISHYNSFASQYSRILELDFYARHCYDQIATAVATDEEKDAKGLDQADSQITADELKKWAFEYLFSMNSIIRVLKIYGTDFIAGHSYYAYTHFRIANFLEKLKKLGDLIPEKEIFEYLSANMNIVFDEHSYIATDYSYHYQMAKDLYERTIQLHSAGKEYQKVLSTMVYLEDDFNDNAYHFGAAFERFMMINGVFDKRIKECSAGIIEDERLNPDNYLESKS